jgi:hypothetical protein
MCPEQETSCPDVVIRSRNAKPDISVIRNTATAVGILDQADCLRAVVIVIPTTSDLFHRCHYDDRASPGVSRGSPPRRLATFSRRQPARTTPPSERIPAPYDRPGNHRQACGIPPVNGVRRPALRSAWTSRSLRLM